jgi:MFS family permease
LNSAKLARRLLFLTCAVLLLEAFFSAVLTPLVPGYRRDLGLTEDATGLLVAAYLAGALLLAVQRAGSPRGSIHAPQCWWA